MTPAQKEATERAEAKMRDGKELLELRNRMFYLVCRIELRDLRRLTGILRRLDDADLKRVAAYAEGLAEWSDDGSQSPDAQR